MSGRHDRRETGRGSGLLGRVLRVLRGGGSDPRDPLTGLPGHAAFVPELRVRLLAARGEVPLAVAVLDVDRLREVNAVFGYEAGDRILAGLGRLLRGCGLGPAFRISGDRFALLVDGAAHGDVAAAVEELRLRLCGPFVVAGVELEVQVSAGLALHPLHGRDADRLLRAAELALDAAKTRGGSRTVVFEPEIDHGLSRRKRLEAALRRAVRERAFTLHFQPQFELAGGTVVGVEALVRWPAEDSAVPPSDFVPVAESTGLIRALGAFVVEEGCRVAARLLREGLLVPVSLNVSPAQLRRPEMAEQVERALARHRVPAEMLELEVTEGLFVDPQQVHIRRNLLRLHELGVRFALDDFGSGYSALAYLKNLPAARIKVDRSFVAGLGRDRADEALLAAIVELGRVFGKRILAEGVETEEQRRVLAAVGCDEAQGYLFARPMPEEELLAFLAARRRAAGRDVGGEPPPSADFPRSAASST